jgi:chemotaxis protein histidine kinase CheA/CheY-like chemotaxis protein
MASCRPLAVGPEISGLTALARLLDIAGSKHAPTTEFSRYCAIVERIGDAGAKMGLLGLLDVCGLFSDALKQLKDSTHGFPTAEALKGLRDWVPLMRHYAEHPGDEAASRALVQHVRRPCWAIEMSDAEASGLLEMLCTVPQSEELSARLSETLDAPIPSLIAELDDEPVPDFDLDESGMLSEDAVLSQLESYPFDSLPAEAPATRPKSLQPPTAGLPPEPARAVPDGLDAEPHGLHAAPNGLPAVPNVLDTGPSELDAFPEDLAESVAEDLATDLEDIVEVELAAAEAASSPEADAPVAGPPVISAAIHALLQVLIDELPQVSVAFDELVGLASAPEIGPDILANAFDNAAEMLARVGATADSLGLAGLSEVCDRLHAGLENSRDTSEGITTTQSIWSSLVPAIRGYLKAPYERAATASLTALLASPPLAVPLDAQTADTLADKLSHPQFAALEFDTPARPVTASASDVSLELPEDANPQLVDALLQELPEQTEELSAAVQRMLSGGSLDDVTVAQRIAHTIKGAGNTVGVRGLAELTHQMEDILLALAKHETLPTPELAQSLSAASDCLQEMAESLQGTAPAPSNSLSVLQDVLDWANRIDREGPPTGQPGPPSLAPPANSALNPVPQIEIARRPAAKPAPAADTDAPVSMLRVPSTLIDDLLRLIGEAMIQNSQLQERVRTTRRDARSMSRQFDLLQQLGTELEELIDLRDLSQNRQRQSDRPFDALEFDQYNELHTQSRRLIEAAVDAREFGRAVIDNLGELNDMLVTQDRLNRDTQEGVLRTRMVPVKTVFPRLERSVRQTCRLTGKQVELHLSGGETQMDSDVLAQIVDPLMHVLRNAVDHGIEDAQRREIGGKDPTGHISLEFLRDGNSILVRCRDDGAGLDFKAIRAVAEERGLVAAGSETPDEVLKSLILLPNFTTRSRATQTSGRGIGLDAVQTGVAALGGAVTLHTTQGLGCVVEVRLPVTLLSSHALLVRSGEQVVAITNRGIEQIRHIDEGSVRHFAGQLAFQIGDQLVPARPLDSVLQLSAGINEPPHEYRAALMVRSERGTHAVLVQAVIASRDLVVKTLGRYVPRLRGVVGATILGDGSVTPVIDLSELLRAPATSSLDGTSTGLGMSAETVRSRRALVVDDSLSARRSMAQVLSDSGFEVMTARDGMEAVETLEQTRPDILFVDLEMPRMDGIELTSHVRARPETANVPVVMVTSRSTEKHRAQASAAGVNAYVTKPFDADTLLQEAERLMGAV